ncbi:MAG: VOC family protein [Terriglobales bacterium]|jgi:catechol 2,3-dioxygenase-like lactoylglutathione lyase family enzyme
MGIDIRGMTPLLQVFDMPTSIAFYRDVLGFEVVSTSKPRGGHFDWALLRLNGMELMLNTAYEQDARPPEPDRARIASHDDTAIFFGCPNVDAAYAHFRSRGQKVKEPKVAPYGMKQLYVHDPDGYNLCFQWPTAE